MTSLAPGSATVPGHGLRRSASFSYNSNCRKAGLSPYSKMHALDELEEGLKPESGRLAPAESSSKLDILDENSKPSQIQQRWHSRLPILPKWAQLLGCILLALTFLALLANQLVALQDRWLRAAPPNYAAALLHYQQTGAIIGELLKQVISEYTRMNSSLGVSTVTSLSVTMIPGWTLKHDHHRMLPLIVGASGSCREAMHCPCQ